MVVSLERLDSSPHVLTGPGGAIWKAIGASPRTVEQVLASVAEVYGVTPADVASDVMRFVDELLELGLVVQAP